MAEKISESSWTDFTKKQKLSLEDKPLIKALAAFDKTSESQPEPRLKALAEIIDQLPKQIVLLAKRKKELGDKPFGEAKDKLNALLDAAERQQRDMIKSAEQDEGDDAGSSDLLTSKMIPLVRELKKGDVRMNVLIGSISKTSAVLISKRSISPARRKLLNEALDAAGGVKFAKGECFYEKGTLFFVLEGAVGGLAKRVRAALLDQTGFRLKVGLRGDDGEEAEGAEEEAEEGEGEQESVQGESGTSTVASTATSTTAPPAPNPAQLAYVQQLRKLKDPLTKALSSQHPESTKLRALMGFASDKADSAHDYAAAAQALKMIERLLDAPATGTEAQPHPGILSYRKALLAWDGAKKTARSNIQKLRAELLKQRPDHADAADALTHALDAFNAGLSDQIDKAMSASKDSQRRRFQGAALKLARNYRSFLEGDDMIEAIDDNPLGVQVDAGKTLLGALAEVTRELELAERAAA